MKKLYIYGAIGSLALYAFAFWKNTKSYSLKSVQWRGIKSLADVSLVLAAALYLPGLLITWTVIWAIKGVKSPGIKTTIAVVTGVLLSAISGVALEVLCVLGICSVDLLTGANGIWGWWTEPIPAKFVPSLRTENTYEA
jgi:hypothetical protein